MSTNKQALRDKIQLKREILDTQTVIDVDELETLLDELEAAERQNGFLREQRDEWERKAISNFEECTEMAVRIEDLESQRQLAFTASNRWADKFREAEQRNAEQAAIIAKQEKWIKDVEATMISATDRAEAAEKRIAELEAREETLRPVGVMSEKAFHRLEGSASRFIALWPRPGIYLPRKRPEDGVIVYARTAGITVKGE